MVALHFVGEIIAYNLRVLFSEIRYYYGTGYLNTVIHGDISGGHIWSAFTRENEGQNQWH